MKTPRRVAEARADFHRRVLQQSANPVFDMSAVHRCPILIDDGAGAPIAGREYRHSETADQPGTIVFFHSGAFTTGDLETGDPVAAALCDVTGLNVLSIDYPLAPEQPYPAAPDTGLRAARWAAERAPSETLVIAGDSAGGNIAAVVTHALVGTGTRVDAQLLFYPCLDLRGMFPHQYVSPDQFSIPEMLRSSYALYLNGTADTDPGVSPALANDLAQLPSTVIAIGSHDPLRHEAVTYAERLTAADVSATVLSFNLMHGFVEHYAHVGEPRVAVEVTARILRSEIVRAQQRQPSLP